MKLTLTAIKSLFHKNKNHEEARIGGLLSREQSAQIQSSLDQLWEQNKPFLKHRYSLHDLSDEINVPVHHLSAFFNKEKGMNFTDYINQSRISYCLEFLKKSEIKKVNLTELSALCGFNNRNTFTISFKKATGNTPSDFIKGLK